MWKALICEKFMFLLLFHVTSLRAKIVWLTAMGCWMFSFIVPRILSALHCFIGCKFVAFFPRPPSERVEWEKCWERYLHRKKKPSARRRNIERSVAVDSLLHQVRRSDKIPVVGELSGFIGRTNKDFIVSFCVANYSQSCMKKVAKY